MRKIRKGDEVIVLRGKDKGRKGRVLKVLTKEGRAIVEGVNLVKKHQRRSAGARLGGINTVPAPVPLCALALVSQKDGKRTRVRFEMRETSGRTQKVRVSVRTGEVF